MNLNPAIAVLVVAFGATFLSYGAAKDAARKGNKFTGVVLAGLIGLFAWGLLTQGFDDGWPSAVGWVAFLAGAIEALATAKETPPFEIVPCVSSDPDVANWPILFCLPCNIQTKAKRTFPPESPPTCPRCGKPLRG